MGNIDIMKILEAIWEQLVALIKKIFERETGTEVEEFNIFTL